MRHTVFSLLLVAGMAPASLAAQAQAAPARAAAPSARTGAEAVRRSWNTVTDYVTRAAEQMPEADYAFKPTPEVRSFGELIAHVAGAQNMFCALALGETAPAEDAIEKSVTGKEGLVAALKKSTEYCGRAYAQTDAALAAPTKLFGEDADRMAVLSLNGVHNGEHYGNIVTYMRIKGMVPPSSQPRR